MGWYELFGNTLPPSGRSGCSSTWPSSSGCSPWPGRGAASPPRPSPRFAVFYVLTPIGLTAMAWNGGLALTLWCAVFAVRSTSVTGRRSQLAAGVPASSAGWR